VRKVRACVALLAAVALALVAVASASAGQGAFGTSLVDGDVLDDPLADEGVGDPAQGFATTGLHHGPTSGHLPPSQANVDLIGKLKVSNVVPEWVTDVATYRETAFLGAWSTQFLTSVPVGNHIPGGVWSVDIKDPSHPRELGFTSSPVGSYLTEGLHAFRLTTAAFTGDVLLVSQERCDTTDPKHQGGFSLYDVTNPANPVPLAMSVGDQEGSAGTSHSAHTAFGWDTGDNAYVAVMDNQEAYDINIFDVTDPRNPRMIKETGLPDWPIANEVDGRGGSPGLHDLVVRKAEGKWLMLASYWDAGYVILDVTNPANPVFMRDSDFPKPDTLARTPWAEGNAHEAEFDRCPEEGVRSTFPCGDVRYVIAADEDFTPFPIIARIMSGPFANQEWGGTLSGNSKQIQPGDTYAGASYFVGLACNTSLPPVAPSPSAIAIAERGTCAFAEKYANILARGYSMMIVMNTTVANASSAPCDNQVNMLITPSPTEIPAIFVSRGTGFQLLGITGYSPANCTSGGPNPSTPAVGTRGSDLDVRSQFDGWGYMRLFDFDTMNELDAWSIPEAMDPRYAEGFGDLSVHEVTTDPTGDVGYVAYYAGGFRVVDFGDGKIREVGHFIDPEGSNFWGVELNVRKDGRLYAVASDRDYGLYIFRFGTDLQVSASLARRGTVGRSTALTSRIRNDGTIAESSAKYRLTLPRGLTALSASASQGRCSVKARSVVCNLGRLVEDAAARVTVRLRPMAAGTRRVTANVNGVEAEYDIGNNRARRAINVRRARVPGAGAGGALTGRSR